MDATKECCWRMLETAYVSDNFEMLVTDLLHWKATNSTAKVWNLLCDIISNYRFDYKITINDSISISV